MLPLLVFLSFWFALCMSQKGSSETLFLLFYSLDRYSGKTIEFAPWPPDRPYDGGFAYNCMMLEVVRMWSLWRLVLCQMLLERSVSDKSARIYYGSGASEASIADEECSVIFCQNEIIRLF